MFDAYDTAPDQTDTSAPPTLVIGLGRTGGKIAETLYTRYCQTIRQQDFSLITVDSTPALPGLLNAHHAQLEIDPVELTRFAPNAPDHVPVWFDPNATHHDSQQGQFSRPLERLAWIRHLAEGTYAPIYRLWHKQLQNAARRTRNQARQIIVFLAADLSESIGGSVFMDAAYITHRIAEQLNIGVTIWGYTLLPDQTSPNPQSSRTFAALKEIERFMTVRQGWHDYPFHYRTLRQGTDPVFTGALTEKPLSAWYCFERPLADEKTIANAIGVWFQEPELSGAVATWVNRAGRMPLDSEGELLVSSTNNVSITLPSEQLINRWSAALIDSTLKTALNLKLSEPEKIDIDRKFQQELWGKGGARSLQRKLMQWVKQPQDHVANLLSSHDALVANVEGLLVSHPAAILSTTIRNLQKINQQVDYLKDLPSASKKSAIRTRLVEVNRAMAYAFPQEGRNGKPEGYAEITARAVEDHRLWFQQNVRIMMKTVLNSETYVAEGRLELALFLLAELRKSIVHGWGILNKALTNHQQQRKQAQQDFDTAFRLMDECTRSARRSDKDCRKMYEQEFSIYTVTCANRLRGELLLIGLLKTLSNFLAEVQKITTQLAEWQEMLWHIHQLNQSVLSQNPEPEDPTLKRWATEQSHHHQYESAAEDFRRSFGWVIEPDDNRPIYPALGRPLSLESHPHIVQDNYQILWEQAKQCFEAFRHVTLNHYLLQLPPQDSNPVIMVAFLGKAETPSLRLNPYSSLPRRYAGHLFAYRDSTNPDAINYIEKIKVALNQRYHRGDQAEDIINPVNHRDLYRLIYSYTIENISLRQDVARYQEMREVYQTYSRDNLHIFGADIIAEDYRQKLKAQYPGQFDHINPEVAHVLHSPGKLWAFCLAEALGLLKKSLDHDQLLRYELHLTAPLALTPYTEDPDLFQAFCAFMDGKTYAAVGSGIGRFDTNQVVQQIKQRWHDDIQLSAQDPDFVPQNDSFKMRLKSAQDPRMARNRAAAVLQGVVICDKLQTTMDGLQHYLKQHQPGDIAFDFSACMLLKVQSVYEEQYREMTRGLL